MNKDNETDKTTRDNPIDEQDLDTNKDIKKRIDKYETKLKAGETPEGDATRSDE